MGIRFRYIYDDIEYYSIGKSFIYNVSGSDHKSIIEIAKIISKIFKIKKSYSKFKLHKLKIYTKNLIEKI